MPNVHIEFNNFEAGERGAQGDWQQVDGSFRALNLIKSFTGELVVRPGLRNIGPAASTVSNGKIAAFGTTSTALTPWWYVQGTAIKYWTSIGGSVSTATGTLSSTPTEACAYLDAGTIYISNRGDGVYAFNPDASHTVTKLTDAPGGRAIAIYSGRMFVANYDDSLPYRLRYSEENDYNTWPTENFIDCDNYHVIGGMYVQNGHLVIMKQDAIFALYGAPMYNDTLRQLARINGPVHQYAAAVGYNDEIVFQGLGTHYPTRFNGARNLQMRNLEYGSIAHGTASSLRPDTGVFVIRAADNGFLLVEDTTDKAALFLENTWTFHQFGVDVLGMGSNIGNLDNQILITDGGGTSTKPKFYAFDPTKGTPGIEGTDWSRAGDDSATSLEGSLTMPMWWSGVYRGDGNKLFRVAKVSVDFRAFNTGSSTTNHFEMAIRSARVANDITYDTTAVTWDEATSSSSASGTVKRATFQLPVAPYGNGFQLLLTKMRGIAIQGFQIKLEASVEDRG
jgi:hypothetical protein